MDRIEKASALLKSAEVLGIAFELKDGAMELKPVPFDEVTAMMLQDLEPYLPEIRSILEKRQLAARSKELIGRRVRSAEFGDGTISEADHGDGLLTVLTHPPADSGRNPIDLSASLKMLIVLPEFDATADSPSTTADSTPSKRGWLADLMRRSRSRSAGADEPRNETNWWR